MQEFIWTMSVRLRTKDTSDDKLSGREKLLELSHERNWTSHAKAQRTLVEIIFTGFFDTSLKIRSTFRAIPTRHTNNISDCYFSSIRDIFSHRLEERSLCFFDTLSRRKSDGEFDCSLSSKDISGSCNRRESISSNSAQSWFPCLQKKRKK